MNTPKYKIPRARTQYPIPAVWNGRSQSDLKTKEIHGATIDEIWQHVKNKQYTGIYLQEKWETVGIKIMNRLLDEPQYIKDVYAKQYENGENLVKFSHQIINKDLSSSSPCKTTNGFCNSFALERCGVCDIWGSEKAREFYEMASPENKDLSIKGQTGCRGSKGVVTGKVKILFTPSEMGKLEEGEILVTPMTTPEFVPAMRRSLAVVTDEGGITCHAAIVSRELNIACVIGTRNATKVLKDGDMVEVDAEKGTVRIIK
jgi:phosphoenolpyruvate synthase/pyruvate phosphate dikinase